MIGTAPLFKFEHLIYPGLMLLNSMIQGLFIGTKGDPQLMIAGGASVLLSGTVFLLVAMKKRVAFMISAVLLLITAAMSLLGTLAGLTGGMQPYLLLTAAITGIAGFGGFRMLRMWKGLGS